MSNSDTPFPDLRLRKLKVWYENAASNRGDMEIEVHTQDRDLLEAAEDKGLFVESGSGTITIYPANQAGVAEAVYESLLETARLHLADQVGEGT